MQSTGQTSTHAVSLVSTQGSQMIYAMNGTAGTIDAADDLHDTEKLEARLLGQRRPLDLPAGDTDRHRRKGAARRGVRSGAHRTFRSPPAGVGPLPGLHRFPAPQRVGS